MRSRKPKSSSQPADVSMVWGTTAIFQLQVTREDARLVCIVQLSGNGLGSSAWRVLAIQTPITTKSVEEVFDSHAHQIIGDYSSVPAAFEGAESFARAWVKKFKAASFKPECACAEISQEGKDFIERLERTKVNTFDSVLAKPQPKGPFRARRAVLSKRGEKSVKAARS